MSIEITCDKCKTKIEGEYRMITVDSWNFTENGIGKVIPRFVSVVDEFLLCVECYDSMIRELGA